MESFGSFGSFGSFESFESFGSFETFESFRVFESFRRGERFLGRERLILRRWLRCEGIERILFGGPFAQVDDRELRRPGRRLAGERLEGILG